MTNQKDNISYHGCQWVHPLIQSFKSKKSCMCPQTWANCRRVLFTEPWHHQMHEIKDYLTVPAYGTAILQCFIILLSWLHKWHCKTRHNASTSYLLECSPYQSQSILSSPLPNFYWQKLCGGRNRINLRLMPCIFNIQQSVKFSRLYYSIGLSTTCELFSSKGV